MPYVNVKITRGGVSLAQKKRIVAEITATLVNTLGKKPEHTHIVIDEIDPENWGYAGVLTTEYRKRVTPARTGRRVKAKDEAVSLANR